MQVTALQTGVPYGINSQFLLRFKISFGFVWIFRCFSLFQFENANGHFKTYVQGTREVCAQLVRQSALHQHLKIEGDAVFQNEFAKMAFDSLIYRSSIYKKSVKCNGTVTLAGPSKNYFLDDKEKHKISFLGVNVGDQLSVPSYKHLFVSRLKFDVKSNDDLLVANYVLANSNSLYVLEKALEINNEAILMVRKLTVRKAFKDCRNIFKVVTFLPKYQFILAKTITPNKFFVRLNSKKEIDYVFKVMTTHELE